MVPEKCEFFQTNIYFQGHVYSKSGIEKIEKIKNWPVPKTPDGLRSFLAFANYYRRFIKDLIKLRFYCQNLYNQRLKRKDPPSSPQKIDV